MADDVGAAAQPLEKKGGAHFLDQIGTVGRSRSVDAQADRDSGPLEVRHRADAGGQNLIAARAMADPRSRLAQPVDLGWVEMNAMGQPRPGR